MSQTIQIVPKFSFPYVETYVNDYTEVTMFSRLFHLKV